MSRGFKVGDYVYGSLCGCFLKARISRINTTHGEIDFEFEEVQEFFTGWEDLNLDPCMMEPSKTIEEAFDSAIRKLELDRSLIDDELARVKKLKESLQE